MEIAEAVALGGQFSRNRLRDWCLRLQRFRATPRLGDDGQEEREKNVQVKEGVTEDAFVAMRQAGDAELSAPRLLLPSI